MSSMPRDWFMMRRIEKLAEYVPYMPEMERIVRERNRGNPDFEFLFGGQGAELYRERLQYYYHAFNSAGWSSCQGGDGGGMRQSNPECGWGARQATMPQQPHGGHPAYHCDGPQKQQQPHPAHRGHCGSGACLGGPAPGWGVDGAQAAAYGASAGHGENGRFPTHRRVHGGRQVRVDGHHHTCSSYNPDAPPGAPLPQSSGFVGPYPPSALNAGTATHDYAPEADYNKSICLPTVNRLLAERLQAKISRDFTRADKARECAREACTVGARVRAFLLLHRYATSCETLASRSLIATSSGAW